MFLVFWFLQFLCKFAFLRTRGGNKEWFFHRFFCIHPHYVTMTKIESRDFALIFSGKRPFNTLSKMELSDIVIVTMDFYLHSAQEMLIWNSQCHKELLSITEQWRALCHTSATRWHTKNFKSVLIAKLRAIALANCRLLSLTSFQGESTLCSRP